MIKKRRSKDMNGEISVDFVVTEVTDPDGSHGECRALAPYDTEFEYEKGVSTAEAFAKAFLLLAGNHGGVGNVRVNSLTGPISG